MCLKEKDEFSPSRNNTGKYLSLNTLEKISCQVNDTYDRHRGSNETETRIHRHYYWPSFSSDVEKCINNCDICQTVKYTTKQPKKNSC